MLASSRSGAASCRPPPMLAAALRSSQARRTVLLCLAQRQRAAASAVGASGTAEASTSSSSPPSLDIKTIDRSGLSKLRVADLRSLAAEAGVQLKSGLKKAELIESLLARASGGKGRGEASSAADAASDTSPPPPPSSSLPPPTPTGASESPSASSPLPPRPLPLPLPPCDAQASLTGIAVTWLGTSSGAPTKSRNVSSVAVRAPRRAVLVDAGEGSARQLADLGGPSGLGGVPLSNVGTILITHLHGDHCFGLPATLAAVCSARAEAARAVRRQAALDAEESGAPGPPPPYRQAPRVLVAGPPGIASVVVAPCLLRGGRGYDAPVLVAEFTTDPSRARPPTRVAGIETGCEVRTATLPPDRTRAAERALAAREEAARRRRGGGGGGRSPPPPTRSRFSDADADEEEESDYEGEDIDEYFGGGGDGRSLSPSNLAYNSATASFTTPPRRRANQASVHAVDVLKGLTWTLPAGTGVFAPGGPARARGRARPRGAKEEGARLLRGEGERKSGSESEGEGEGGEEPRAAAAATSRSEEEEETAEERKRREAWERKQQQLDMDLLDPPITIVAAQLQHRVPCWGYALSLTEPTARGGEEEEGGEQSEEEAAAASDGRANLEPGGDGETASSSPSLSSSSSTRKVVILGDTCDSSAMAAVARGADLLSHEATFSDRMFDKAEIAQHSTAAMAGSFAAECGAKRLVLTHFSARYPGQGMERASGGNGWNGGNGGGGRFGGGGRGGRGGRGRGGYSAPSASDPDGTGDSLADDVPSDALDALVEEAKREFVLRSRRKAAAATASGGSSSNGGASPSSSSALAQPAELIEVVAATDLLTLQLPRKVTGAKARGVGWGRG